MFRLPLVRVFVGSNASANRLPWLQVARGEEGRRGERKGGEGRGGAEGHGGLQATGRKCLTCPSPRVSNALGERARFLAAVGVNIYTAQRSHFKVLY